MKQDIHPLSGPVVITDTAVGTSFLTRSTLAGNADRTMVRADGETYPEIRVDISAVSHPFWTGAARVIDTAGQVEEFRRRHGSRPGRGDGPVR